MHRIRGPEKMEMRVRDGAHARETTELVLEFEKTLGAVFLGQNLQRALASGDNLTKPGRRKMENSRAVGGLIQYDAKKLIRIVKMTSKRPFFVECSGSARDAGQKDSPAREATRAG